MGSVPDTYSSVPNENSRPNLSCGITINFIEIYTSDVAYALFTTIKATANSIDFILNKVGLLVMLVGQKSIAIAIFY